MRNPSRSPERDSAARATSRRHGFGPRRRCASWIVALLLVAFAPLRADKSPLDVRGLGWFGNRDAEHSLKLLLGGTDRGVLDPGALEDAGLILISRLTGQGYLEPRVVLKIRHANDTETAYTIDAVLSEPLPRPLDAVHARFEVGRGPRFTYREIEFTGLTVIPEAAARAFFVGESLPITLSDERAYSPARHERGLGNLREELRQRGHADATVTNADLQIDRKSGDVRARIAVVEGRQQRVERVTFQISGEGPTPPPELLFDRAGRPWSALWRQDAAITIRRWYFRRGYPDVNVTLRGTAQPVVDDRVPVEVLVEIAPGSAVKLGRVRFVGQQFTREAPLRRLIRVPDGGPFNPVQFDNGQSRLARLGVFKTVEFSAEPAEGDTRDAVYHLQEGRRQEVNLLLGYGSYEQLRGGVEWRHFNLWGRAHTDNLKLVQSMKSSRGNYTYTVPSLFGSTLDGSARLFGLHREELAFTRDEFGGNVSIQWPWRALRSQLSTGYTIQHLRNTHSDLATEPTDLDRIDTASLDFTLVRDRRDNPLTPHRGTKLFVEFETASRALGGEVDYQRARIGGSYHTSWGTGRWVHAAVVHGAVLTLGSADDTALPVNVRFFPGGDGSIRGYQDGEAAPRAASGQFIGAKSYVQLNLEFEQALTSKWSVVVFGDALGTAARVADYPFDEKLYSVGLGVRYKTPIGPVRLEYGHNLNPRPLDPNGTLQLSIGAPF